VKRRTPVPPPAVLVSDASAFAAVGLSPRQFRDLVRERGIRSARVGRRTVVRLDDLLAALGLGATTSLSPARSPLDDDQVVQLAVRRRS